jgi:UDP-N-acetyl-D-glucosamine dehydrogenase
MYNNIKKKIKSKNFSVGIVGLGYVGLPLALRFIQKKIRVYGVDSDKRKVRILKQGKRYIKSINTFYFKKNPERVSSEYFILKKCDVIFVCLPTPLKYKRPDLSYINSCGKELKKIISKGQTIVLESTVYPGVTRRFIKLICGNKFILGKDVFAGYSPERENPGDRSFSYKTTPKVVSGHTQQCLNIIDQVYKIIVKKTYIATNMEVAESSKLLENTYRAVNIALVNEFKMICEKLKINVLDVIDSAATKNFGFQKFLPGPGWGGHCIPIDPFYLSWLSNKYGYNPLFIKNSAVINNNMPKWILNKVFKFFVKKKKIKLLKILIIGISYKKNVDDDRESPSFEFMNILDKKNIQYDYYDPYFKFTRIGRKFNKKIYSIKLTKKKLQTYDCAILVTDHDRINYIKLANQLKVIFDTRGVYHKYNKQNIVSC